MLVKILIFLVAVVVLIVIIAFLALRYLRADDSDPFDELPDEPRRQARPPAEEPRIDEAPTMAVPRQPRPALANGQQRQADRGQPRGAGRPAVAADRTGGPGRERQPSGYRERGSHLQPAAADRKGAQNGTQRPLAASSRSRRASKNGQEPNWDSLSDVDYWAELAADKPMAATAEPAPTGRRSAGQGADARPYPDNGRAATRSEAASGPQAPLPLRQQSPQRQSGPRPAQPAGAPPRTAPPNGAPPRTAQPLAAAAPRSRSGEYDQPRQPDSRSQHAPGRYRANGDSAASNGTSAAARLSGPSSAASPLAAPTPLTGPPSPSAGLPPTGRAAHPSRPHSRGRQQIAADDDPLTSPSFPAINTSDSRSYRTRRADSQPGIARPAAAYGDSGQQYNGYSQAPERPARLPDGYPSQPGSQAPVGNPYGSYVSQPATGYQQPVSHQDVGYPGGYQSSGRHAPRQAPAPVPAQWPGQQASLGSLGGSGAALPGLGPVDNGYPAVGSHQQLAGGNLPYPEPALYPQPAYQADQYDQRGYAASDMAYGLDPYSGYPGGSAAR